ncbi:MAG: hypothetical protein RL219_1582 [Actinomycetota bacterium]
MLPRSTLTGRTRRRTGPGGPSPGRPGPNGSDAVADEPGYGRDECGGEGSDEARPDAASMPTPSHRSRTNRPTPSAAAGNVLRRLDLEWEHLVRSTPHIDLEQLLIEVGWRPPVATAQHLPGSDLSDARLAIVVAAARSDTVAARVVLQRLLPGLVAIARRRCTGMGVRTAEVLDELVSQAWITIRHFPVERRPTKVAGNLLRDIEYHTFTRPARLRRHGSVVGDGVAPRCLAAPPGASIDHAAETAQFVRAERFTSEHPFTEVIDVLITARQSGFDDDDVRFLGALSSGVTTEALAAARSVSARAERYRRARLIARLQTEVFGVAVAAPPESCANLGA